MAATLVALPAAAQEARQPEDTLRRGGAGLTLARRHMVAAAHPLASEAGREILRRGGSAADAAVTVQLVLNLVEPQSSGIGGGAFALHWDQAQGRLISLDGRETAPASATPDYWLGPDGKPLAWFDAVVGGRAVGVPGTLALLHELHRRHGRLPWARLFQPAIDLAETGFAISPRLAGSIARADKLDLFGPARAYFFQPDGSPKPAGTMLRNPDFAKTLRRLAAAGPRAFYAGELARAIVAAVRTPENSGELSLDDFARYRVIERAPVCVAYRRYRVCGIGPPSSGAVTVGQILGLLRGFDLAAMGPGAPAWHLFAEASRLAYADRARYLADDDYVPVPVAGLLSAGYLADRAALIDAKNSMGQAKAGDPPRKRSINLGDDRQPERAGTSHFVIADADGDMVSMTSTIETGFGSRLMVGGFLLNNELTDFSRLPERQGRPLANRVEGGKRPRSSMAPTIVFAGARPVLLIGSPGGSRIIAYVAQALVAILDFGLPLDAALALGHVVNRNGPTDLEAGSDAAELAAALKRRGHEVRLRNLNSGLHAIQINADGLAGAADPRREGVALGD